MALSPKIEIVNSLDCLSFSVKETTGIYSAGNTGGYGTPNPATSAATEATLTVVLTDGTTLTFDSGDGFYPLFPNTTGVLFTITNVMMGLSATTAITDWITYIGYTVNVGATPYNFQEYAFIGCQSGCCVSNMLSEVDFSDKCDACDKENLQTYLKGLAMINGVYNALKCAPQLPNKAAAILTSLTELCASSDRGCGC